MFIYFITLDMTWRPPCMSGCGGGRDLPSRGGGRDSVRGRGNRGRGRNSRNDTGASSSAPSSSHPPSEAPSEEHAAQVPEAAQQAQAAWEPDGGKIEVYPDRRG